MKPTDFIKQLEGCRLSSYQDRGGKWTIGWGTTGHDIVGGITWPQQMCDDALDQHVARDLQNLMGVLRANLSDNQLAAVLALVYNIGFEEFRDSTILRRLNAYDFRGAADAWIDPLHIFDKVTVNGVHVEDDGLKKRRIRERALFLLGSTSSPSPYPPEAITRPG